MNSNKPKTSGDCLSLGDRSVYRHRGFSAYRVSVALISLCAGLTQAGWVYDTPTQMLSSGDFDGDGRVDVLVVDRTTGNVRVGYQSTASALTWSASRSSGVPQPTGLAVGRFFQSNRDAIALTSPELNRIHLLNLSSPSALPAPSMGYPPGLGPTSLAGVPSAFGPGTEPFDYLAVSSAFEPSDSGQRVDLMSVSAGTIDLAHSFRLPQTWEHLNSFQLTTGGATFLGGMLRSNADTFVLQQFTNTLLEPLLLTGLPASTEFIVGQFAVGPRILFYQPGTRTAPIGYRLNAQDGRILIPPAIGLPVPADEISLVQFVPNTSTGFLLVSFADGSRSILYDWVVGERWTEKQTFAAPANETIAGFVPTSRGQLVMVTTGGSSGSASKARVYQFSSGQFALATTSNLTPSSSAATRAGVLLFDREPFVGTHPALLGSLAAGDWVTSVSGLPGTVLATVETDRGSGTGLGNSASRSLGAAPASARFGLPNQLHPSISVSALFGASGLEASAGAISPSEGRYSGPIAVQLRASNPLDSSWYRLGSVGPWLSYNAVFVVSHTLDVAFYFESIATGARSRIQTAQYEIPILSEPLTPMGGSNLPPIAVAGGVQRIVVKRSTSLTLDGTGSRDPEGGPLRFAWTQTSGQPVTLQNAATATPRFLSPNFSNQIVLRFRLTVTDDQGAAASQETAVVLDDGCTPPVEEIPVVAVNPDGSFRGTLEWPGLPGEIVRIQASPDLENWVDLGTGNVSLLGYIFFTDLNAGIYPVRFYRAIKR